MFGKLLNPFTTAAPIGVAMRYLSIVLGAVLAVLGIIGYLDAQQVAELRQQVDPLIGALGALVTAVVAIYGIITKSSSDKAAEAAAAIDKAVPPETPVVIKTPEGMPDILVRGADQNIR